MIIIIVSYNYNHSLHAMTMILCISRFIRKKSQSRIFNQTYKEEHTNSKTMNIIYCNM